MRTPSSQRNQNRLHRYEATNIASRMYRNPCCAEQALRVQIVKNDEQS